MENPICIIEVNENLRRVKLGMELTRPLKQLNTHCEFKTKYNEWCDIEDGVEHQVLKKLNCVVCNGKFKQVMFKQVCCSLKCSKFRRNEYLQTPEHKVKMKEYKQTPEHKVKMKEYNQRPEVKVKKKEYDKEYSQRPEVKVKKKENQRIYQQRPESKSKRKEYYQNNKEKWKTKN